MRLEGKTALVTGAGSGNGAGIAAGFAREGAAVVYADLNAETAEANAKAARDAGYRAMSLKMDVASLESVTSCVDAAMAEFGPIDILVSNAGIQNRIHLLDMTEKDWDTMMNVNAKGVFFCGQAVARHMVERKSGSIINMASISSFVASMNNVHYGASKGAVQMMTMHMAVDLAPYNIRVNAIAPGVVVTGLNRERLSDPEQMAAAVRGSLLGRVGSPEDLVGAALYLASDESSWVTGTTLTVDGGWMVR